MPGEVLMSELKVLHILKSLLMYIRSKGREKTQPRSQLLWAIVSKLAAAVFASRKVSASFACVGNKEYDSGEMP